MSGLTPVFSTGRGGAGNMVSMNKQRQDAANEVVLAEETRSKKNRNRGYKAGKDGKYTVSYGRGGAGNIQRVKEVPSAKVEPQVSHESKDGHELKQTYTVGRGGAGNVVRGPIRDDPDNDISPIHSSGSGRGSGLYATVSRSQEANKGHKFIGKLKKLFN